MELPWSGSPKGLKNISASWRIPVTFHLNYSKGAPPAFRSLKCEQVWHLYHVHQYTRALQPLCLGPSPEFPRHTGVDCGLASGLVNAPHFSVQLGKNFGASVWCSGPKELGSGSNIHEASHSGFLRTSDGSEEVCRGWFWSQASEIWTLTPALAHCVTLGQATSKWFST